MTVCIVKGVTHSDELAEEYHSTLQAPSAQWSILASFSLLFFCPALLTALIAHSKQRVSDKSTVQYWLSTEHR